MKLTHGVNLLVDSQGDCALARSPADAGASAVNELDAIDYKWAFYNL